MGASESPPPPIAFCRLPLSFDADELARDVAGIATDAWITHFNAGYHDGGWSGVALRSVDGNAETLYPGHLDTVSYADTPLLAGCPRIRAALESLSCPVQSVRLLRLSAGGVIREHRDEGLRFETGLARLHVPIATGRDVEFYLAGDLVTMTPGDCWYLNFDLPHRVQNLGRVDRLHLVIDCEVNDWLRALILTAAASGSGTVASNADSSQQRFERFRALVLDDPTLTDELWAIHQPDMFVERLVALGRQRGFWFTAENVLSAMRAGARGAAGRWIVT